MLILIMHALTIFFCCFTGLFKIHRLEKKSFAFRKICCYFLHRNFKPENKVTLDTKQIASLWHATLQIAPSPRNERKLTISIIPNFLSAIKMRLLCHTKTSFICAKLVSSFVFARVSVNVRNTRKLPELTILKWSNILFKYENLFKFRSRLFFVLCFAAFYSVKPLKTELHSWTTECIYAIINKRK